MIIQTMTPSDYSSVFALWSAPHGVGLGARGDSAGVQYPVTLCVTGYHRDKRLTPENA